MAAITAEFESHMGDQETTPRRAGLFARMAAALRHARIRAAEEEVARLIEARGGRLTDAMERQIERSFI